MSKSSEGSTSAIFEAQIIIPISGGRPYLELRTKWVFSIIFCISKERERCPSSSLWDQQWNLQCSATWISCISEQQLQPFQFLYITAYKSRLSHTALTLWLRRAVVVCSSWYRDVSLYGVLPLPLTDSVHAMREFTMNRKLKSRVYILIHTKSRSLSCSCRSSWSSIEHHFCSCRSRKGRSRTLTVYHTNCMKSTIKQDRTNCPSHVLLSPPKWYIWFIGPFICHGLPWRSIR